MIEPPLTSMLRPRAVHPRPPLVPEADLYCQVVGRCSAKLDITEMIIGVSNDDGLRATRSETCMRTSHGPAHAASDAREALGGEG